MREIRRSAERGHADHGWLVSKHSFSFANYRDPAHMGVRALRVINEDRIAEGTGFGFHSHRDMEILSWVLEGLLEHKDSMGNGAVIAPGEIQRMSAGTGVTHSEKNPSKFEGAHFLQIWLIPDEMGLEPGYEQKEIPPETLEGRFAPVASRDGREGSVVVHTDATLYVGRFDASASGRVTLAQGRTAYVYVARGDVQVQGESLHAGDAMRVTDETEIEVRGDSRSEVLVFDLA